MKKLPLGIQTFEKIIADDYIYVDKTEYIYSLINRTKGDYYFLSRPRRFGKSLLVSTLKELFSGNKHLFKDLWISTTNYDWQQYPVIYLDFSRIDHATVEELKISLSWTLTTLAEKYNIVLTDAPTLGAKLSTLIEKLSQINKVVVLIDEYDKPILDHLHNPDMAQAQQAVLRDFYATIKSMEAHLRFIFMTGVTKFSKTSVFSGLNNLQDLTLNSLASALLGYTHKEIDTYFKSIITRTAQSQGVSYDTLRETIKAWYNGYQFSQTPIKVYNPYSVLLYLSSGQLLNYWFETGTPSFLVQLIKAKDYPIEAIEHAEISALEMGSFDIDHIDVITLLLQTGYLTINSYNEQTRNYQLRYPNEETKISFLYYFVNSLTTTSVSLFSNNIFKLTQALKQNNLDLFFSTLQIFFAAIPYNMQLAQEKYYQSIFYVIVTLIGAYTHAEVTTNKGRIDAVIETTSHIYIFEFKLDQSATIALAQIEDKQYYQKYLHSTKHIVLVGASFSTQNRNIKEWIIKDSIRADTLCSFI
ncbi:ATP-binding protein [Candidatus Dependentiae bacterium]|nr:ATP-binding protein [Candidatus Dependentiae bacterium]